MKKRILSILLSLVLMAALLPTGLFAVTVSAADTYKTDNVTVPEGWDYIEVRTAKELQDAFDKNIWWENNFNPPKQFIRLMDDIKVSETMPYYEQALIYCDCTVTTTLDFNGHKISGYILEGQNRDNKTWSLLNIHLYYGQDPDITLRLVDSVGGGGVSLNSETYVEGPTCALTIHSEHLGTRNSHLNPGEAPYHEIPYVVIDGGSYYVHIDNEKAVGRSVVTGMSGLADSKGAYLWDGWTNPWGRNAVHLEDVRPTINNGHFTAKCLIEDSLHGKTVRRYVAALGIDNKTAGYLKINGGLFDGDAFAIYNYTYLDSEDYQFVKFPTLNGGTFKGGIMLISGEGIATWKNIYGYDLNGVNRKRSISTVLLDGARMFIDGNGTRSDPEKTTLEDIAWPHDIVVRSGPDILGEKLQDSQLLASRSTSIFLSYNKTPDSITVQHQVKTTRAGQEILAWTKLDGSNYYKLSANPDWDYYAYIPAQNRDAKEIIRVAAKFGDITLYSQEYEIEWYKTPEYKFTLQPAITKATGDAAAYVSFNFNYAGNLNSIELWKDVNRDHYRLVDADQYGLLTPDYTTDGNYRIWFTELYEAGGADDAEYMIRVEYNDGHGGTVGIDSDRFELTKDMLVHNHVYPDTEFNYSDAGGHAYICKDCGGGMVGYSEHVPGPEATETEPQVCVLCGRILVPAGKVEAAAEYTFWFDANGGTGEMEELTYFEGIVFELPENGFTPPEGKVFKGWSIGGEIITEFTADCNATFYAVWADASEIIDIEREDIPTTGTAYESKQEVEIDGQKITMPAYALKDSKGYPTNYVRLRDLADLMNGTAAQFDVLWDAQTGITVLPKTPYDHPNGTEGNIPFSGNQPYAAYLEDTTVGTQSVPLTAFKIEYNGGGHTYYKLRDLGKALGFNVGWSTERGIFIETEKPYTDAD